MQMEHIKSQEASTSCLKVHDVHEKLPANATQSVIKSLRTFLNYTLTSCSAQSVIQSLKTLLESPTNICIRCYTICPGESNASNEFKKFYHNPHRSGWEKDGWDGCHHLYDVSWIANTTLPPTFSHKQAIGIWETQGREGQRPLWDPSWDPSWPEKILKSMLEKNNIERCICIRCYAICPAGLKV